MLSTLRRWLQGHPPLHLRVEGTVVETGTHEPRTHLGPVPAPTEGWLRLQLSHAQLSNGTPQALSRILPPEFSGPEEVLKVVSVGDRVRIATTTATGRQIAHIEVLSPADGTPRSGAG